MRRALLAAASAGLVAGALILVGWRATQAPPMPREAPVPALPPVDGQPGPPPAAGLRRPWWWVGPSYALDLVPRFVEDGRGRPECPTDELVRHPGTHVRYRGRARVHAAFVPRLERFETLVAALATEHFGRPPRRLIHKGAFNCRRARGRRHRVSEHALGNALDVRGFDFGRLPRDATAPDDLPRHLRRGFRVRVGSHWDPRRRRDRPLAAFLHELVETLRTSPDIFRGIVGPPRPRHHDHLHLDVAPWRYALYRIPRPPDVVDDDG